METPNVIETHSSSSSERPMTITGATNEKSTLSSQSHFYQLNESPHSSEQLTSHVSVNNRRVRFSDSSHASNSQVIGNISKALSNSGIHKVSFQRCTSLTLQISIGCERFKSLCN